MASGDLPCWAVLKDQINESSALLGNGFSINLNQRFHYERLFEASELPVDSRDLFKRLRINDGNFERALASLTTAKSVVTHLGMDPARVQTEIDGIRSALIRAVKRVHPEQSELHVGSLGKIHHELFRLEHVFTTNYDLLLYWSTFGENGPIGDDSFRRPAGQLEYVPQADPVGSPQIHYLHGALHLASRDGNSEVLKTARQGQTHLLEGIEESWRDGLVPLFVCEGSSTNKVATINRHGYLVDQLYALRSVQGDLVIVGHQLAERADDHIVDAINEACKRNKIGIAVGLFQGDPAWEEQRASIKRRVSGEIVFFDSRCHPLMPQRPQSPPGRLSLRAAPCPHSPN